MTDNEVIKALECCGFVEDMCLDCPVQCDCEKDTEAMIDRAKAILDLINRQKAEIERLQNESIGNCEMAVAMRSDHNLEGDCHYCIDKAKSEAIKEFAERLKGNLNKDFRLYGNCTVYDFTKRVDSITEEMVGAE